MYCLMLFRNLLFVCFVFQAICNGYGNQCNLSLDGFGVSPYVCVSADLLKLKEMTYEGDAGIGINKVQKYIDSNGVRWFVKTYAGPEEYIASKFMHALMGDKAAAVRLVHCEDSGRIVTASREVEGFLMHADHKDNLEDYQTALFNVLHWWLAMADLQAENVGYVVRDGVTHRTMVDYDSAFGFDQPRIMYFDKHLADDAALAKRMQNGVDPQELQRAYEAIVNIPDSMVRSTILCTLNELSTYGFSVDYAHFEVIAEKLIARKHRLQAIFIAL